MSPLCTKEIFLALSIELVDLNQVPIPTPNQEIEDESKRGINHLYPIIEREYPLSLPP